MDPTNAPARLAAAPPIRSAVNGRAAGSWGVGVAAVLVLVLGVVLRLAYYDNNHGQSDEAITVEVVHHLRSSGDWDDNWKHTPLSADLRYDQYNFSTHLYATYFFYRAVKLVPGLEAWRSRDGGFAVYRMFVALLAGVTVLQVFWLGRRLFGAGVGIGAALLTSVMPLLVQDAHYVRPEAFTTVLTLGCVALCLPRRRFSPARTVTAAVLVGLLIACKVSMLLLAWVPVASVIAAAAMEAEPPGARSEANGRRRSGKSPWVMRWMAAIVAAIAVGFVAGVPPVLVHWREFLHGVAALRQQYGGVHLPHSHPGGAAAWDLGARYFVATLGRGFVLAFAYGLIRLMVRRRWLILLLVAGPVVVFASFFATQSVFFERNLSHVVPLACIIAAYGVIDFAGAMSRGIARAVEGGAGRSPRPTSELPNNGGGPRPRPSAIDPKAGRAAGLLASALVLLTAIRPASLTARLVVQEYTGRATAAHDAFDRAMVAANPHAEKWDELLLTPEPLDRLAAHFRASQRPVLMRVTDYADEATRANLAQLRAQFVTRDAGDFAGTFPDLPTCTLLTYHTAHDRYVLVERPR